MAKDYPKIASEILAKVGGQNNVSSLTHCMTRLRFTLKDETIPVDTEVSKTPGVIQVVRQGGQYQVVIGNDVGKVFAQLQALGHFSDGAANDKTASSDTSGNLFNRLCGFVAGCMSPLMPAMLGCGMIKVIMTLLTTLGFIDASGSTAVVLSAAGDAFFYFLPILLGYTTAKKLGSNPFLAMVVAGLLLHPDLIGLLANGNTTYFGLPVTAASYSSSVLPILLMVPIMCYIEKFADRVSPDILKSFLKPMIVIFISIPIALVVVGPLGSILGTYLADGINVLYSHVGWLAIMVISAAMPFIVMTGMHWALLPLATVGLSELGYDAVLIITMYCYNLAQGAAALAVAVKSKDNEVRSTATASGLSAMLAGVTEPALYGITMKYKTPLIAGVIGSAAAGLYAGLFHLVAYSMGASPSMLSLLQMIGTEGYGNLINGLITMVIAIVVTFVVCLFLYKPEEADASTETQADTDRNSAAGTSGPEIFSPLSGRVVPLQDVPDDVFSSEVLGKGTAVIPTEGKVYAPADGEISSVVDSGHAIGITAASGAEILIHVGLDTIKMNGRGFTYHVKEGQRVHKGDLLISCDLKLIKAEGFNTITPVLVTNTDDYSAVTVIGSGEIKAGTPLLHVE